MRKKTHAACTNLVVPSVQLAFFAEVAYLAAVESQEFQLAETWNLIPAQATDWVTRQREPAKERRENRHLNGEAGKHEKFAQMGYNFRFPTYPY